MSYVKTILIEGKNLENTSTIYVNPTITLDKKRIVSGVVYDENNVPKENVIVEVVEVIDGTRTNLGYTITDQNGNYMMALSVNQQATYEFLTYQ